MDSFKNGTKREWDGSLKETGTIDILDERFETVDLYIDWLYSGTVGDPTDKRNGQRMFLSEACAVGEKSCTPSSKRTCLAVSFTFTFNATYCGLVPSLSS